MRPLSLGVMLVGLSTAALAEKKPLTDKSAPAAGAVADAATVKKKVSPSQVIKSLYEAQKSPDTSPFFQAKKRELVDKYFTSELGELIWKDAIFAGEDIGALDFDPLYYSQDPQITKLVIEEGKYSGGPDGAFVTSTFKNGGKAEKVQFELLPDTTGGWKIQNIIYSDGEDLRALLIYAADPEVQAQHEKQTFKGDYLVGKVKCTVTPTMGGIIFKVQFADQKNFQLYYADGSETQDDYIYTDDKDVTKGRFTFKKGKPNGKFINAKGEELKVSPVH